MSTKRVIKTIYAYPEKEGGGALVRKGIHEIDHTLLDPFVSLVDFSVSRPGGFRDHAHRGFESVTYMLKGGIIHQDFNGNKGIVQEGDVQWMTAGRGIVHSEMPEEEYTNNGLQLWVNLHSSDKMIDPKVKELSSSEIPRAEEDGVEVKVIAGNSMGVQSPFYTKTPIMFLDFTLEPRARIYQAVPASWTAFAYIIEGDDGVFSSPDSSTVPEHHVVVFGPGEEVSVLNTSWSRTLRFLLIAGEPIDEPVVQDGPFVMNSRDETDKAIRDYHHNENGFEMARYWRSD